jgi:diguanylate cyclase (GGDEF)-like protein
MSEDMMNRVSIDNAEMEDAVVDVAGCETAHEQSDETGCGDIETGLEKPAVSEFQAAADTFSAAFNTALYEIETSRRLLAERSARISELNEAIQAGRSALDEEVDKGRRKTEEYLHEAEQLKQRIHDAESERDALQERVSEQEKALGERAAEIGELSGRLEDVNATLDSRTAEGLRAQEEFESEKAALTGRLNELQGMYDEANSQLQRQLQELEECNREIPALRSQVDNLLAEVESRDSEVSRLEGQVKELQSEIDAQAESIRMQSESHATVCEELNAHISGVNGELETLRALHADLQAHAEKLENLNHALHESSVTEKAVHKQELEEKSGQIESLRSRLESTSKSPEGLPGSVDDTEALEKSLHDLEAKLEEAVVQNQELGSELSASEERCRQLEAALAMKTDAAGACAVSPLVQDNQQDRMTPDRTHFVAHLDGLLSGADRSEEHHSLMYVLLDNFMMIRDEIGILKSESVVREVARIVESECKADDVMARFGDCTFAILCSNATAEEVEERAGRICAEVESRIFEYGGRSLVTTTSIGICSVRKNDSNSEQIISRVDLACDAARLSGGNRVMVSSTIADEINMTENDDQHEEMVRSTLAENRIKIYYQPISSLRGQAGNHFEVLVRLVDKSGDMILPGEFFAMAEAAGCANEVDCFVIDKALEAMSGSNDEQVKYYIKLTRQSVAENNLADWIMSRIDEYGVKPEQLVFEIAENVLQSDLKNVASLSKALHAIGCKIAIEHYRMATSLQHLMHVYADYLKIDKGLVGSVDKRGGSLAKVTAIMDVATKNNYLTIAEGVESPACLAIMWELGVSMAQGYFIHAPAVSREYVDQDIISDCHKEACGKATFVIS